MSLAFFPGDLQTEIGLYLDPLSLLSFSFASKKGLLALSREDSPAWRPRLKLLTKNWSYFSPLPVRSHGQGGAQCFLDFECPAHFHSPDECPALRERQEQLGEGASQQAGGMCGCDPFRPEAWGLEPGQYKTL